MALVVLLSGNMLVSINVAALYRTQLVMGRGDQLCIGKPPRYVTSHQGQLSLVRHNEYQMSSKQMLLTLH